MTFKTEKVRNPDESQICSVRLEDRRQRRRGHRWLHARRVAGNSFNGIRSISQPAAVATRPHPGFVLSTYAPASRPAAIHSIYVTNVGWPDKLT